MTRLFLIVFLIAAPALTGCDQQAAQYAAAQEKLDQALAILAIAQQGYAPLNDAGETQDMQVFRQQQLASAQSHLREVTRSGSEEQQVMARRLLASTQLSAARYAARNAIAEFAELSARTPVLVSVLQATERAAARANRVDVDYDAALAQIATDAKAFVVRRDKLRGRGADLKKQLADWQAKHDAAAANTALAMAEARTAMDKTFVAEAEDRMALQDQTDVAQRRAAVASAEAEKHQIQIDLIHNRLVIVNTQHQTLSSQIQDLKQRAKQTLELQAITAQNTAEARQERDEAAEQVKIEFDLLAQVYRESIRQPLVSAAGVADEAAGELGKVGGADQLSGYVDQASINTKRAIAAAGWANMVSMILTVAEAASLSDTDAYRSEQQQAQADSTSAEEAAHAAITAGRELAESLAATHATLADQQTQRLNDFEKQLAKNTVK